MLTDSLPQRRAEGFTKARRGNNIRITPLCASAITSVASVVNEKQLLVSF
jgi:hypothetical protein